jgi:hypothetical protein
MEASFSSVSLLPFERMADMTALLLCEDVGHGLRSSRHGWKAVNKFFQKRFREQGGGKVVAGGRVRLLFLLRGVCWKTRAGVRVCNR